MGLCEEEGNFTGGAKWLPVQIICYVDITNIVVSAFFSYILILVLICLRYFRSNRLQIPGKLFYPNHETRFFISLLFLLAQSSDLADVCLNLLPNFGDKLRQILIPLSAILYLILQFILQVQIESSKRNRWIGLLIFTWGITAISRCAKLFVLIEEKNGFEWNLTRFWIETITILCCCMFLIIDVCSLYTEVQIKTYPINTNYDCIDEFSKKSIHEKSNLGVYRHSQAPIWSRLTFAWLTRLIFGSEIKIQSLGDLPIEETTAIQCAKLRKLLFKCEVTSKLNSFWMSYFKFCSKNFLLGGFLKFLGDCMTLVGPLGISVIIQYVTNNKNADIQAKNQESVTDFFSNGYIIGCIMFLAAILQGTLSQYSTHLVNIEGIRLKVALQGLIYEKSLKIHSVSIKDSKDHEDDKSDSESIIQNGTTKENEHPMIQNQNQDNNITDIGTITNLMGEDVYNVMRVIWIGHYTWAIPLKITVLIYLLHGYLGISAVIGALTCIATMTPLQFIIGKKMATNIKQATELSDERIRYLTESLRGMFGFKLLNWENFQERRIRNSRREELKLLDKDSAYSALITFLTHISTVMVTLVTFGVHYFFEKSELTAANIFSGLALFNQLTVPLFIFPVTVPIIIDAIVSTKRLHEFFSQPEIIPVLPQVSSNENSEKSVKCKPKKKSVFYLSHIEEGDENEHEIEHKEVKLSGDFQELPKMKEPIKEQEIILSVQNIKFSWIQNLNKANLVINNLTIPKDKLTIIVGKTGSGKTSLISAILGEMYSANLTTPTSEPANAQPELNKPIISWRDGLTIAYAAQKPWLLESNIRENILFGSKFRSRRYRRVLEACGLRAELSMMPEGDRTTIGETTGTTLSGGQKQRVAIARVLYSNASVNILDDPFSSLDCQVTQNIFDLGIKKMLLKQKRTVILVTHHLQLLPSAHQIIVMDDGKIKAKGSLNQIKSLHPALYIELTQPVEIQNRSKSAKDRWSLFRNVAQAGFQLRTYNNNNNNHSSVKRRTSSKRALLRKQPSSIYGSRYNLAHDLPLPTDERDTETDAVVGGTQPRARRGGSTRTHKAVTRAVSLQPSGLFEHKQNIARQASSPILHDPVESAMTCPKSRLQKGASYSKSSLFYTKSTSSVNSMTGCSVLHENEVLQSPVVRSNSQNFDRKLSLTRMHSINSVTSEDFEDSDMSYDLYTNNMKEFDEKIDRNTWHKALFLYVRSCGIFYCVVYLFTALGWQVFRVLADYCLSNWTENETRYYLIIYSIITAISVLLSIASNVFGQVCGAKSRRLLHAKILTSIFRATPAALKSIPIGQVLNRFSTDMSVIDKKISTSLQRLFQFLFLCASAIIVNAVITPLFLIPAVPLCLVVFMVQNRWRSAAKDLQHADSATRTPALEHLATTLRGLSTLRAHSKQQELVEDMYRHLDRHTSAYLVLNTISRWLGIVLDYLGGFTVLGATLTSIGVTMSTNGLAPALVGLAVNYTLLVPIYLTWVIKFVADADIYLSAVERIQSFIEDVPQENYKKDLDEKIPENWPENGKIEFQSVNMKYENQNNYVIENVNVNITAGQKVGICGRSGSGKSSLVLSLFGATPISSGRVLIDGHDISKIPLDTLRTRLAVIPQEVPMFSGTIRQNLDPEEKYSDAQLWSALEKAQIKQAVTEYLGGLDGEILDGGINLSGGEQQLISIARAILSVAKIIILDEPTGALDVQTQKALLDVVRDVFKTSTVIMIAHRIETILECDRILVLEQGRIVEDDSPEKLKNKKDGIFANMLKSQVTSNSN